MSDLETGFLASQLKLSITILEFKKDGRLEMNIDPDQSESVITINSTCTYHCNVYDITWLFKFNNTVW